MVNLGSNPAPLALLPFTHIHGFTRGDGRLWAGRML
jgi:hypothetical protein